MASTTIDNETELSAVNAILGAIGQSPITSSIADSQANPEVAFIYNLLRDANVDVQNEGWHFNTEKHVTFTPDENGKIAIANDILKMDTTDGWVDRTHDVIKRNGFLYDKQSHSYDFSGHSGGILLDIVRLLSYEDLPSPFKRYIIYKASVRAATQLVGNAQLAQLLAQQESISRATVMEYECNQGNHTMFGLPEDSVYNSYQPWRTLGR